MYGTGGTQWRWSKQQSHCDALQAGHTKGVRTLVFIPKKSTSVAWSGNRSRVVFQSFFTTTILHQDSLPVFSSLPCFCTFYRPIPTCARYLQKKLLPLVLCVDCTLADEPTYQLHSSCILSQFDWSVFLLWLSASVNSDKLYCSELSACKNILHRRKSQPGTAVSWC